MRPFLCPTALIALLGLAACETTAGFGRDLESAGGALQRESAEAQYNQRLRQQRGY